jgi:ATP-dependent DNA helicase RecG
LLDELKVAPKPAAEAAESLGLRTIGDLLLHLPRESGEARAISELRPDEVATVMVEVKSITSRPVRKRGMRPLVEATVGDATGVMKATFFNQPWLANQYAPGTRLALSGKYQARNRFRVNAHAKTESIGGTEESAASAAQYPATKGITSTQILALFHEHADAVDELPERLAATLRVAQRQPTINSAVAAAHLGDPEEGRTRLAFEELLVDQIVQLRLRRERRSQQSARSLSEPQSLTRDWLENQLPFAPTGDQLKAIEQVDADLAQDRPMQRLLMGEVGSGKTVVAVYAMLRAVEHGAQGAMMAPTEVLAEQHFATLQKLMPGSMVSAALLTGSTPAGRRRDILGRLRDGSLSLIVGTHALIEDDVEFAELAVAVIDEQHRFGVRQRARLDAKAGRGESGLAPHVLHMTATPIPRTLRLATFGALDVTELRELPRGRQPIATHVCSTDAQRERAYERIRTELDAGRQAFVVCPLVSESEAMQARAATDEAERLRQTEFSNYKVELLHGQMKSAEKAAVMERFSSGAADVLVATTVIEVGIDVPNTTVMVIEDAERYGISQLHQLRGRVGRGEHASLCLLFGPADSRRLKALEQHTDGFRLAEIDLELRGEGELTGTKQSGDARYRFAMLPTDGELLARAHGCARDLLGSDPQLQQPENVLLAPAVDTAYAGALAG